MANNYHYLIGGLPELVLDFESSGFNFDALVEKIIESSTSREKKCIRWFVFGVEANNLGIHFYKRVRKFGNNFLNAYFSFDLDLRNILTAYSAHKSSIDPSPYLVGDNELVSILKANKGLDSTISLYSEMAASAVKILDTNNILEREKAIDLLRWKTAEEIVLYNLFDIDYILSLILKAAIIRRWSLLDKEQGAALFRRFVEEVRGTFKLENN